MNDDVLVKVDNVSKRFCRSLKKSLWYGLQDLGSELGGHRHGGGAGLPQSSEDVELRKDEFWAVKDVSFELRRGECLGLIGRNGAGKTTLLRMLNGLIKPDTGSIKMLGSVGALIALGAGFNPVLTGRENIYVSASILGLNENSIKKGIAEIIEFSDIGDFIDAPVQSYSSGMQVRLGFAIASQWLTNIILLDEVLAVGDMNFRNKCFSRLSSIKSKGGSFILVSHDMHAIARVCDKCILMSEGGMYYQGDTIKSICLYEAEPSKYQNKKETIEAGKLSNIYQVDLTANGKKIEHWNLGQAGEIVIFLQEDIREDLDLTYIFTGTTDSGQSVTCRGSCKLDKKYDKLTDSIVCIAKTNSIVLPPGSYSLKLGVWGKNFSLAGSVESMPIRVVSNDKVVADSTHYQDFK